jgi:PAS domain S-box-containing protein
MKANRMAQIGVSCARLNIRVKLEREPTAFSQRKIVMTGNGAATDADASGTSAPDPETEISSLRALVEGTAQATGDDFFRLLVQNLSAATGVSSAFIAEFAESKSRVRALAFWSDGEFLEDQAWDLEGTPCQDVVMGKLCHYPNGVSERFPIEVGVESYLGVPLLDDGGEVIGHLAIFDKRPMPAEPRMLMLFRIFAARASAELARVRVTEQLLASEERFRDLFEEAPIAYVHEDMESRFLRANRTAMRILGITPEQVDGMVGKSLAPDTPQAQKRVFDAFESIKRGIDTDGVVLELQRKDNGEQIFIQWWSRPDPSGDFTRTMFVDITDRVRAEQERQRLTEENRYLQEEIDSLHDFDGIIGQSPALARALQDVRSVAGTDASVLILGETGTGKELFARAIHSTSVRAAQPLISVNCAALPAALVESELFGHEKGAFTGATAKRVGRFALADGGTIFLDEVGELPLEMQAKLLRILQEGEFEPVGSSQTFKVDVRIVTATNRDLARAVDAGEFREDLYYRINVFPIAVPPLRERGDDVGILAQSLMERFAARYGRNLAPLTVAERQRLAAYPWPGNVRELINVIERAVITAEDGRANLARALPDDSGARTGVPAATSGTILTQAQIQSLERENIEAALRRSEWRIAGTGGAADLLGMKPSTLSSRIKTLDLKRR